MAEITIRQDNPYHVHRVDIAGVAQRWDIDIASASRKWASDNNVAYGKDLEEFEDYVRWLQAHTNKGRNLVARYFRGEDVVIEGDSE